MTVTLSFFLGIYLVLLVVLGIFSVFNLFHMLKYGTTRLTGIFSVIAYVGGIAVILIFTFSLLKDVKWSQEITLFQTPLNNNLNIQLYEN